MFKSLFSCVGSRPASPSSPELQEALEKAKRELEPVQTFSGQLKRSQKTRNLMLLDQASARKEDPESVPELGGPSSPASR